MRLLRILLVLAVLLAPFAISAAASGEHSCADRAAAESASQSKLPPRCATQGDEWIGFVAFPALAVWIGTSVFLGVRLARHGTLLIFIER
jgi:hypothetical protein